MTLALSSSVEANGNDGQVSLRGDAFFVRSYQVGRSDNAESEAGACGARQIVGGNIDDLPGSEIECRLLGNLSFGMSLTEQFFAID